MSAVRVLLVDDHRVVRAGFRRLLEEAPGVAIDVVGEAQDARGACRAYVELEPDVAVMDLALPDLSGVEAIRRITARAPDARILVLSMHEEPIFAEQALAAGARGYLTKSAAAESLVDAVRAVMAGPVYLEPRLDRALARRRRSAEGGGPAALSAREFEVFRQLAEGRSAAEIAAALCLSYKTVANYATRVRAKLGVTGTAGLVRLAIRHGVMEV